MSLLSLGSRVPRLLLVVMAACVLSACGPGKPEVARVGEQDVAATDLQHAVALQRVLADIQGAPCGGQPAEGESADAACDRAALSGELLWLAVAGYADANDITATDSGAEEAVAQLETQVGADVLRQALGARDLTREDLLELGRRILTIRAVRTAVAEDRIGADELRTQYDERVLEFTTVQANHILVESRAEAESVYRRVRNATQTEFAAVAKRESTEPGANESGGDLGSGPASQFVPEFASAVAALEPGAVSQPVQSQFGWHVIYLVDKEVTPFEEAKAGLVEPVADQEFRGWLEDRADAVGVEVNPRYGRFSPDSFTVLPARSTDLEGGVTSPSP